MRRQTVPPAIRREVIRRWGNDCWLHLPGCTRVGEEDDHIVPWSHSGRDSVDNIRRACKHCNASRQDRVLSGYGPNMHVVMGPPGADLMGAAEPRLSRDSIVVSHADLMRALCPEGLYPAPPAALRAAAGSAWDAAYRRLAKSRAPVDVWLLRTLPMSRTHPRMLDEWVALDYDIRVIDPGADYVFDRARLDADALRVARQWYALHLTQDAVDARLAARRAELVRLGLRSAEAAASNRIEW
ncbi:HNH endonuclease [Bifidobacterium choerinum]|uniref:HNH endonuclease n=1 Tax=Bifidobacterium choerinum TaxID=35760 RepID=A0A2D3D3S7_9BIFI|nr:HNH endonuclease [Bifidobacterium choerinum]ATU19809.1 HNH endonuclease [Bifidobacterium choerinum]